MVGIRRFTRYRRGQALAEFAILLPLLAILLAGVIDVGRGLYARIELTNAVREGARYAATHPADETDIKQAVLDELASTSLRDLSQSDVTISTPEGTDAEDPVTVSATAQFHPFMGTILGIDSIPLSASATMMIISSS